MRGAFHRKLYLQKKLHNYWLGTREFLRLFEFSCIQRRIFSEVYVAGRERCSYLPKRSTASGDRGPTGGVAGRSTVASGVGVCAIGVCTNTRVVVACPAIRVQPVTPLVFFFFFFSFIINTQRTQS